MAQYLILIYENEEAYAVTGPVGRAHVCTERWLPICSRRDEIKPSAGTEDAGAETGHRISALVLKGHWRHRHEDVVR